MVTAIHRWIVKEKDVISLRQNFLRMLLVGNHSLTENELNMWDSLLPLGQKVEKRLSVKRNTDPTDELNACFERAYYTNSLEYEWAFQKTQFYFQTVKAYIETLSDW